VYDGKVEEPVPIEFDPEFFEKQAEKEQRLLGGRTAALKRQAPPPPADQYSFRASGSNTTLRQMIVVNGRFVSSTNGAVAGFGGGSPGNLGGVAVNEPAPTPTRTASPVARRLAATAPLGFGGSYGTTTNSSATIEGTVSIGATNQQWFRALRDAR
jgi:hypothetical protein